MMKRLTLTLCCLATPLLADETRMDWLKDSYLIEHLEKDGDWDIIFTPSTASYTCAKCTPPMSALIQVQTVDPSKFGTAALIDARKKLCAALATDQKGRCVSASPRRLRAGTFQGFRFETETPTVTIIRLQFPYHLLGGEPETITGTIIHDRDTSVPDNFENTLLHHMLHLTAFY